MEIAEGAEMFLGQSELARIARRRHAPPQARPRRQRPIRGSPQARPANADEFLGDPFVVSGGLKLFPKINRKFSKFESLISYVEIYNLTLDASSREPAVKVNCKLLRNGQAVDAPFEDLLLDEEHPGRPVILLRDRAVLVKHLLLRSLSPGHYDLEFEIEDQISGQKTVVRAPLEV